MKTQVYKLFSFRPSMWDVLGGSFRIRFLKR